MQYISETPSKCKTYERIYIKKPMHQRKTRKNMNVYKYRTRDTRAKIRSNGNDAIENLCF